MSWTNELYQVYENNNGLEDAGAILLPISHSTANAQIEVMLSEKGELEDAVRITDKNDMMTIIPVTEDSGTRSSGIAPHPLEDKLIYIAGDYSSYVSGKRSDNSEYYQAYLAQLKKWKESEYSHPAVEAIFSYLSKGHLIRDLVQKGVLLVDEETGKLKEKEKILGILQEDCFVRFRIFYQNFLQTNSMIWKDRTLYQSFIDYNSTNAGAVQLCYATGRMLPCTYKHPSKIRNPGDKAKLISSNDESGFSYRGRFDSKEQALSVSYEFSQKMHNALKWLIKKQDVHIGSMTMVMWESNLKKLPNILSSCDQLNIDQSSENVESEDLDSYFSVESEEQLNAETVSAYRSWLSRTIWGNKTAWEIHSKAMIMLLDAATPGRLSMAFYEEMPTSQLLENIEKWHADTSWVRFDWKSRKRIVKSFTLYEILDSAYGTEQNEAIVCKPEIKNNGILRLIPCVIDGQRIPMDIVNSIVDKAVNPQAYKQIYNWRKVIETACGMLRKTLLEKKQNNEKGDIGMALDRECHDRDYLYGRLLAIAEAAEASTYEKGEGRITNAQRYFETFSKRPYQTWDILYKRLVPYLNGMPAGQRIYYEKKIGEVKELFDLEDFVCNRKLAPVFLLAYHCQLNELYTKKTEKKEDKNEHSAE